MEDKYEPVSLRDEKSKRNYRRNIYLIYGIFYSIILFFILTFSFTLNISLVHFILIIIFLLTLIILIFYFTYILDKRYRNIKVSYREYISLKKFEILFLVVYIITLALLIKFYTHPEKSLLSYYALVNMFTLFLILIGIYLSPKIVLRNARILKDKELIKGIEDLCNRMNIKNAQFLVLRGEKLKIANAFQMGTHQYYVGIYDYLLKNLTKEESLAVIAHELAHIKLNHIFKARIITILFIFYELNAAISLALIKENAYLFFPILLSIFIAPYFFLIPLRKFEKEADLLAIKYIENPKAMISSLEKLSDLAYVPKKYPRFSKRTHPDIQDRIDYLNKFRSKKDGEIGNGR